MRMYSTYFLRFGFTVFTVAILSGTVTQGAPTTTAPPGAITPTQLSETEMSVTEVAKELRSNAQIAGSSAYLAYSYILENFLDGQVPAPAQACFSEERTAEELDGTDTNHLEALVEDYRNLSTYIDYLDVVEEQYNYTLSKKPTCGYCVRFLDLKRASEKLLTSLEDTIKAVNSTAASSLTRSQEGRERAGEDDPCYQVCYDQQARVYLRLEAFAGEYIIKDVSGLIQEQQNSKN